MVIASSTNSSSLVSGAVLYIKLNAKSSAAWHTPCIYPTVRSAMHAAAKLSLSPSTSAQLNLEDFLQKYAGNAIAVTPATESPAVSLDAFMQGLGIHEGIGAVDVTNASTWVPIYATRHNVRLRFYYFQPINSNSKSLRVTLHFPNTNYHPRTRLWMSFDRLSSRPASTSMDG